MNTKVARQLTGIGGILLLVALLVNPTGAAQVSPPETITLVLKAPAYQLEPTADGCTLIHAEGYGVPGQPGQPLLPHQMVDVALPPDVAWNSLALDVRDVQTAAIPGAYQLCPAIPYLSCTGDPTPSPSPDQGEKNAPFPYQGARLLQQEDWGESTPPPIARIAATGQMRKWRVARVDFSPFQYDATTGQLRVVEQATVELRYARTGEQANADQLADTVLDDVASAQFVNYAAAQAWYPPAYRASNVLYDYAIVTTNAIWSGSTKLNAFIAHKRAQGHHLWIVTETDYGTGAGRAEKVRQWLKNNYAAYGIKYVLLIGDPTPDGTSATAVPMKMCWPRNDQPNDKEAPTDYFFADLTGDWDVDGDNFYGEYIGDYLDQDGHSIPGGVDLLPEVYVGRIPFYGNYTDLDAILQKTINYETATDISWRKSILLPMSFIDAGYDTAPLAEQMWSDFLSSAGYSRWRVYQQGHGLCPSLDSTYPSDQELFAGTGVRDRWAANDYGIVCWWAHGNQTVAGVGYGDSSMCGEGFFMESSWTAPLDDDHPAFTYQSSCATGWPENTNNLQYAILKHGGIATVAASRSSFNGPTPPDYHYFDHGDGNASIGYGYLKRVVNGYTASEALYQTKFIDAPYIIPYPYGSSGLTNMYDLNLYGDPDVRITDRSTQGRATLSIPAAAFQPAIDGNDYENHGRFLKRLSAGASGSGHYLAPVQLPHGATVTAVTFHWYDAVSGLFGSAELKRTNRAGSMEIMASTYTFDEGGYGSFRNDSIGHATIDNVNYTYWVDWSLASTPNVMGCSVTIEYIPPPAASKGYLSLPAAAFQPFEDGYNFENAGIWLAHYQGPGGSSTNGWYLAPVQLPQGATVTKLTFFFYDDSATNTILARLQRSDLAGNYYNLAYVDSAGYSAGYGNRSTTTIANPVIDNRYNSYWVVWDGPVYGGTGYDASGVGVLIEYNNPATVQPGRLSVPAPAFTPYADDWQYQNHGRYLIHQGGGGVTRAHYEAPVYLPQGTKVTKVTFWFNDDSTAANGYAHLCRTDQAGNYTDMAYIDSYYAGGYASRFDNTIDDPVIDNSRYAYWVYWDLPISTGAGNNVWGTGVTIEYTVPMVYLPLVLKN